MIVFDRPVLFDWLEKTEDTLSKKATTPWHTTRTLSLEYVIATNIAFGW